MTIINKNYSYINNIIYEIPEELKNKNHTQIISNYKFYVKIGGYKLNIKKERWEKGIIFKKIIPAKIKVKDS